jgi:hypothetical protein
MAMRTARWWVSAEPMPPTCRAASGGPRQAPHCRRDRQNAIRFYAANGFVVTYIGEKCPVPNASA